jgi:hypothetical protein
MTSLIAGAIAMGYLVAALHFLKFWRGTKDRLFLAFAGAFILLAIQRVGLVLSAEQAQETVWLYGVRMIGFVIIIVAILDKNRGG